LKIVKIFNDQNLILVNGNVPGAKGSFVIIEN
jgi:ribosomal protein L3